MIFTPYPDPNLYQDANLCHWRRGGITPDGYFVMFEVDPADPANFHPVTHYHEEIAPHEMPEFEIIGAIG